MIEISLQDLRNIDNKYIKALAKAFDKRILENPEEAIELSRNKIRIEISDPMYDGLHAPYVLVKATSYYKEICGQVVIDAGDNVIKLKRKLTKLGYDPTHLNKALDEFWKAWAKREKRKPTYGCGDL